jgi:hypothetical protein
VLEFQIQHPPCLFTHLVTDNHEIRKHTHLSGGLLKVQQNTGQLKQLKGLVLHLSEVLKLQTGGQ